MLFELIFLWVYTRWPVLSLWGPRWPFPCRIGVVNVGSVLVVGSLIVQPFLIGNPRCLFCSMLSTQNCSWSILSIVLWSPISRTPLPWKTPLHNPHTGSLSTHLYPLLFVLCFLHLLCTFLYLFLFSLLYPTSCFLIGNGMPLCWFFMHV